MTSSLTSITTRSPLGELTLVARGDALAGVYLPAQAAPAARRDSSSVLARAAQQLAEYFAGERQAFDLPLAPEGTAFQLRVWRALAAIAYGATSSYGELARAIGAPVGAARAIGAANSRNPISIVVPCHRVVGATGELTGYAGGLPAKRWLLDHEQRHFAANRPLRRSQPAARGG